MVRNLRWRLIFALCFITFTRARLRCTQDFNDHRALCSCTDSGIKNVPRNLMKDLVYLSIDDCDLTELQNDSFTPYPKLATLILSFNNISKIDSGAFLHLKRLKKIDLSYNPFLPRLDGESFNDLILTDFMAHDSNVNSFPKGRISIVSLMQNKIDRVTVTCKDDDIIYKNVNLQSNNIRRITHEWFVFKCTAVILDLTDNPNEEIDPSLIASLRVNRFQIGGSPFPLEQISNLFEGVKRSIMTHLQLENVGLETIYPGLLSHLKGKRLENFDLSHNNLQNLPDEAFLNLSSVYQLTLDENSIQFLNPREFNGIKELRILSLKQNKITLINKYRYAWNVVISELLLTENRVRSINMFSLKNMTSLRVLDLSYNEELQSIGNESFIDCPTLESLDLSGTSIYNLSLDRSFFSLKTLVLEDVVVSDEFVRPGELSRKMGSLEKLNLEKTTLFVKELWDPIKNISTFHGLHKLKELILSNNLFPTIQVPLFTNLSQLSYVKLSSCKIFQLQGNVFNDLQHLKMLDLDSNSLQVLEPKLLHRLTALEYIFLSDNGLTYLDKDVFDSNIKLVYVYLAKNEFTSFTYSTFQPLFPSLRVIGLADNPLVCNCEVKWLSTWLHEGSVRLIDGIGTVCVATSGTLSPFRGKQLITFDPSQDCGPNIIMYSSVVLAGVASLLLAALIYYNRWLIGNRLFLLKLYLKGYEEILDDEERKNFRYDLNLIFHHTDEGWVTNHLRPSLEERLPEFDKISCGDEDLMISMYYLDAVNYAVENSFKDYCGDQPGSRSRPLVHVKVPHRPRSR